MHEVAASEITLQNIPVGGFFATNIFPVMELYFNGVRKAVF